MKDPTKFIEELIDHSRNKMLEIRPNQTYVMEQLEPILSHPGFNRETMSKTSKTAADLCVYVTNFAKLQKISLRIAS